MTDGTDGTDPSQVDPRLVRTQWRLARAVLGDDAVAATVEEASFDPQLTGEVASVARRSRTLAEFAEMVASGTPMDQAAVRAIRVLAGQERPTARGLALGLEGRGTPGLSAIGLGLVSVAAGELVQAWGFFAEAAVVDLARLVPVEAVGSALAAGTPEASGAALEICRIVAEDPGTHEATVLAELAGRLLVTGHRDLAVELGRHAASAPSPNARARDLLANLERWLDPPAEPETTGVRLGVIDYPQPDFDHASRNVGDYVQTLAMLGNLGRFPGVRFHGPDGLGDLMSEVQQRVRPVLRHSGELAAATEGADVTLLPVSRDYSPGEQLPPATWLLAFGWHMHPVYNLGFGLPYHPNLRPLFVSFHLNRVGALTPETIDYLRERGPIGCRDWTTVDILLSAGVDAFFTGCVTTTVDAVFPRLDEVDRSGADLVAAIDLPPKQERQIKQPHVTVTHHGLEHRKAGLVPGVRAASELLGAYQHEYKRIVTSRLHAYLPATSLGVPVRFRPKVEGDVRFDGLLGMEPDGPPFTAMRDGIRELLAEVLAVIMAGADEDAVRARWRELTEHRVAEARTRLQAPGSITPPPLDLPAVLGEIARNTHRLGPHDRVGDDVTDVAMSLDQNLADVLPVTVESLVANASGPVRLWVTARGLGPEYRAWFADQFPDLPVTFLGMDHVDYGEVTRLIAHTTVATMDRLFLPEMLDRLDRLTYVDIDTVVEGDVCELARTDLRGHPLAARTTFSSGAEQWRIAGDLLDPETASELRRTMAARHPFDFTTFNAGVLVLDLARLRSDRFTADWVPLLTGRYGLNDQDIFNAYAGADRADLPARWNTIPMLERATLPGIVHYVGAGKPWAGQLTPEGHRWRRYADAFRARCAPMPPP